MTVIPPTPDINYYQQLAYYAVVIAAALIGVIGILIGMVLHNQRRTRTTGEATLNQVKNTHETNMRDDLDEKFEGMADLIKTVIVTQETQGKDLGGMRSELRQIGVRYDSELEDTRTRLRSLEQSRRTRRTTEPKERQP